MEVARTHESQSVIRLIISLPIIVCGLLVVIALMLWIVIALTFVDNIIIMAAREMMVVMVVMIGKVVRVMPDSLVSNCFFISFVLLSVCSPIRLADFFSISYQKTAAKKTLTNNNDL